MILVDTHCHLDFNLFDSDRETVLERAHQERIKYIINPGIDLNSSKIATQLAGVFPGVYAAVGVHPTESKTWTEQTIEELRTLAQNPRVVAIGEIGLDYYRGKADAGLQKVVFQDQLSLAKELDLPVIVHSRAASDDLFDLLSKWYLSLNANNSHLTEHPGVMHSFEAGLKSALQYIKMNFFIGIGGPVTFKNAYDKHELAAGLPIEHILLETDAPFLTPHPYRGKRNEPGHIKIIAEKIAEIRDEPLTQISDISTKNAAELFRREFVD